MKKWIALLVAGLFFVQPIKADLIVTPRDEFFLAHEEECHEEFRYAIALEDVPLYQSPVSDAVLGIVEKGGRFYIDFSYVDPETEELWYVHTLGSEDQFMGAWMKAEQLSLLYNEYDFNEEHHDEIINHEQNSGLYLTKEDGTIPTGYVVLWEYPNAPHVSYYIGTECAQLYQWRSYTDELGVEWRYVTSDYARAWGWVRLDQLTTLSLTMEAEGKYALVIENPEETKEPIIETTPDPVEEAIEQNIEKPMAALAWMVAGVTVLTGLLIRKFWKK